MQSRLLLQRRVLRLRLDGWRRMQKWRADEAAGWDDCAARVVSTRDDLQAVQSIMKIVLSAILQLEKVQIRKSYIF